MMLHGVTETRILNHDHSNETMYAEFTAYIIMTFAIVVENRRYPLLLAGHQSGRVSLPSSCCSSSCSHNHQIIFMLNQACEIGDG